MARWEPNAADRLRVAAMELFLERGYEATTVADIADRAGLTARTFFRYFADKREVLFAGTAELQERMTAAVADAPEGASPMRAIATALDAASEVLGGRRDFAAQRQLVISANTELRERELIKMAMLCDVLTDGLRARGVPEVDAVLVAETGIAVFRTAFERWVTEPDDRQLRTVIRESLRLLRSLAADRS